MKKPDLLDLSPAHLGDWLPEAVSGPLDLLQGLQEVVAVAQAEGYECDLRTLALARLLAPGLEH